MALTSWDKMGIMGGTTAGLGGLAGLFGGGGLFGKPERTQQFNRFTQPQQSALSQLLQQGMQNFNPEALEKQAMTRFNTEIMPGMAENFTAMPGEGGQRSSGFAGTMGQAGAGLAEQLAAMRSMMGGQQLQMGLQPQIENIFRPRQQGGLESGFQSIMQLLPFLMFM